MRLLRLLLGFALALRRGLTAAVRTAGRVLAACFRWIPRAVYYGAAALLLLLLAGYCIFFDWVEQQATPDYHTYQVRYLDQGWGTGANSPDRMAFYDTPQGVYLRNIPYDWLVNLERPWKSVRFMSAPYQRGYGFVVEPASAANPGGMPVGITRSWDSSTGQWMTDMTCALCHTGELDTVHDGQRIALRIDGGPSMADLTSTQPGHFSMDLFYSLLATYLDPFKFERFSARVLEGSDSWSHQWQLHAQLGQVLGGLLAQASSDSKLHLYPVQEGPGRTDALGRIANQVFATDMHDPHNYHVADAPVSYPPLWNIWKFDWVQYGASVRQPMARNLGESLGTGAHLELTDAYGRPLPRAERFMVSTIVPNLRLIENTLQKLRAPCWPNDLWPINLPLARQGAQLFAQFCETCHGPHLASPIQKSFDAPLKTADQPEWVMHTLATDDIGTDPTTAWNFVHNQYDLTPTGLTLPEVQAQLADNFRPQYQRQLDMDKAIMQQCVRNSKNYNQALADQQHLLQEGADAYVDEQEGPLNLSKVSDGLGLTVLIAFIRPLAYQRLALPQDQWPVWNGFGQLDTPEVAMQYKPRPLGGVWSTAPYLHDGAVPNLYQMLSPVYQRSKVFYLGDRQFDPENVGLVSNAKYPGAFRFDTSIPGNFNVGHEFRAGYRPWTPGGPPSYGHIGPEFTPQQRRAIVEYLKVHRDDPNDHSCSVDVPLPPAPPPLPDPACALPQTNLGGRSAPKGGVPRP